MKERARRARDLRAAGDEVHAELLTWQRGLNIGLGGEKDRLDPSLQNAGDPDHIWKSEAQRFYFGTRVPYSIYHQAYRLRNGMPSHMRVPASVMERIGFKLSRYIMTGGTT